MESKKSDKANIERRRTSILLVGMVCATSTVLMSFEYASYKLTGDKDLVGLNEEVVEVWEFQPQIEEQSSSAAVEQPVEPEYVAPDPEPEPDPNPTPDPDPDPQPLPPIPGPPGDGEGLVPVRVTVIDSLADPVDFADEMPEYPGGIQEMYKFIGKNIVYPEACYSNDIQGKTYVQFTVEKDGSITDIKIIGSVHKLMDKESSRVVGLMPKWKPGKVKGKSVRVNFKLPINFKIEN